MSGLRVRPADVAELLLLAALWGASFLFMRLAAPAFGAVPLAALRVSGAALLLLPLAAWRGQLPALRRHWRAVSYAGVLNSGLPFACFSYASLSLNAGLGAILNATAPMWAALVAWAWLGQRPGASRLCGLALGFGGVVLLACQHAGVLPQATPGQALAAMGACLLATLMYGYSATYARVRLGAVPPLALAAGSQLASALLLALPALRLAPATLPGPLQWAAALGLAVLCTGLAYVLFFRLIARLGPAQAISVTFVIPAFAMLWGALFLHEAVSPAMLAGCAVILLGTALAVGLLRLPGLRQPRPAGVKNGP